MGTPRNRLAGLVLVLLSCVANPALAGEEPGLQKPDGEDPELIAPAPTLAEQQARVVYDEPYLAGVAERYDAWERGKDMEWIVLENMAAVGTRRDNYRDNDHYALGFSARLFTLRWPWIYLTVLEGGFGASPVPTVLGYAGSQVGLDLALGDRGQHHLRAGLGVHFAVFVYDTWKEMQVASVGLALTPTVTYLYDLPFGMVVGAAWRALCPVAPRADPEDYGAAMIFSTMIGY